LGTVGRQLVRQACAAGQKVLVVDSGENALHVESAIELGATLITGEPTDAKVLERAGIRSARYLLAGSDDDTMNIEVGLRALEARDKKQSDAAALPLDVYIHIADPQLGREVVTRGVF
jgi:Trk K+ transport system NAD-binding subunit